MTKKHKDVEDTLKSIYNMFMSTLDQHEAYIQDVDNNFTLTAIQSRIDDIKGAKERFQESVIEALDNQLSAVIATELKTKFDDRFYIVESQLNAAIKPFENPKINFVLIDASLKSCEEQLQNREQLTVGFCHGMINDLRKAQVNYNVYIDYELMSKPGEAEKILREQHTFVGRINNALIEFHKIISDLESKEKVRKKEIKLEPIKIATFDGTRTAWPTWRDQFLSYIHNNNAIEDVQKIAILQNNITDPKNPVKNWTPISANYQKAWKEVFNKYEDRRILVSQYFDAIFKVKSANEENSHNLDTILNGFDSNFTQLKSSLEVENLDFSEVMMAHVALRRLDSKTRDLFQQHSGDKEIPVWSKLREFLQKRSNDLMVTEATSPSTSKKSSSPPQDKYSNFKSTKSSTCMHTTSGKPQKSPGPCILSCTDAHKLSACPKFKALSPKERNEEAQRLARCSNCLGNHKAEQCKSTNVCREENCGQKHHTMLHISGESSVLATSNQSSTTILSTVVVSVKGSNNEWHKARVCIDSAATDCYMRQSFADALGVKKQQCYVEVTGFNESAKPLIVNRRIETFISNEKRDPKHFLNFYVVPQVTQKLPTRKIKLETLGIPDQFKQKMSDPNFHHPSDCDILLGNNIAKAIETGEIKKLDNGVQIFGTIFGYALAGSIPGLSTQPSSRHIVTSQCFHTTLRDLNETLGKFYKLEDYRTEKRAYTNEEILCEEHFQRTHKRLPNGRFQVDIPFNGLLKELGSNSGAAFCQFKSTEKRMQREPETAKGYIEFMREYEESGDMSEVSKPSSTAEDDEQEFVMSHHPVFKPDSTTTKTRIVFNGKSRSKSGLTLNDTHRIGPVVQSDSFRLITRARQHGILVKADISKFYRRILVNPAQRKYQRIYWRENPADPLRKMELNTVTYGLASSSFLSTRCLKQLADDFKDIYPEASRVIAEDFFVDDLLSGAPTVEEADTLRKQVIEILDSAVMKLRKFITNSSEFANLIPEEDKETCTNKNNNFKALGVVWNPDDDEILFEIDYESTEHKTKRVILSSIAKPMALDPTGLLAPVIVKFKIFMKKIHQLKTTWDSQLPEHLSEEWDSLTHTLKTVNELRIPRRVIIDNHNSIQLIAFCDASKDAYGAGVYVRSISEAGEISSKLLVSKSHVADDGVEIPKLELCSIVVASALMQTIAKDFVFPIEKKIIYSDSTIALSWILNGGKGQQTFVFNRAQKVRKIADDVIFRHIPTTENPADLVSRGILAHEIVEDAKHNKFWWEGPSFLKQDEQHWSQPLMEFQIDDDQVADEKYFCENDVSRCYHTTAQPIDNPIFNIVENTAAFDVAKKKVAELTRSTQPSTSATPDITHDDLKEAEFLIAREYQKAYMTCEFNLLSSGKPISRTSNYLPLSIFWDSKNQLIRGGGRNVHSSRPYAEKHPIILPRCPLVRILVKNAHLELLHAGKQNTMNLVKRNYHPVAFDSVARDVIRKCNACFRVNARLASQQMAPLPSSRLEPTPAFHYTGIDFAGPVMVKTSKIRNSISLPAYLALFICLSTKSVHIEVVSSLTTADFILALTRFINRRPRPRRFITDNGLNFVGASNQLAEIYEFLQENRSDIASHLTRLGVEWHFIPPRAPNHGGLWEANIKVAKRHLYASYMNAKLTFEELTTVCTRIEAIMNSRPLVAASSDPNDCNVITPNHLLTGHPLTALPEPDLTDHKYSTLDRYDRVLKYQQECWNLIIHEYINQSRQRPKNRFVNENVQVGMKVMLHVDKIPSLQWPIGKVVKVYPGKDGLVRVVDVETPDGTYKRAITKIAVLPTQDDTDDE